MIYLVKMFIIFRQCSEFSDNVQNFQSMFRIFSQCSESVQTFSEFLVQKLVYSEFLDFVVMLSTVPDLSPLLPLSGIWGIHFLWKHSSIFTSS